MDEPDQGSPEEAADSFPLVLTDRSQSGEKIALFSLLLLHFAICRAHGTLRGAPGLLLLPLWGWNLCCFPRNAEG